MRTMLWIALSLLSLGTGPCGHQNQVPLEVTGKNYSAQVLGNSTIDNLKL